MAIEKYQTNLQFKAISNDALSIAGYASVFNMVDNYNDIIVPGSFKDTISGSNFHKIKLLWQHDHMKPIGIINRIFEDKHGLFVEAIINNNTQQGRETASLIMQGAIDGFSIGFEIEKSHFSTNGERIITAARLWEISVVTFPANASAQISKIGQSTKSMNDNFKNYELIKTALGGAEYALKCIKRIY